MDGVLTAPFTIRVCSACGAGFTSPVPDGGTLAAHYREGVYQVSGGRASVAVDAILSTLADAKLAAIAHHRPTPGALLDLGCGKGRFLGRAAARGWAVQGVETSFGQAGFARDRYGVDVKTGTLASAGFAAGRFDVVTAWHVLEHVHDPRALLAEVHRVLRPRGLFACEVPNFASVQSRMGGASWLHLDVPRHLVHFTPASLARLLDDSGFLPRRTGTFSAGIGLIGSIGSIMETIGSPPYWLFRYLKRMQDGSTAVSVAANLARATLSAAPAVLLEIGAAALGRGGVITVFSERV